MFTDMIDGMSTLNENVIPYFETCLGGYKSPDDNYKTLFQFGQNVETRYFDWLFSPGNEERAQAFVNHMKFKTMGPRWFQGVPVADILGPACGKDDVLLVDVGGAAGHDLEAFHAAYPDMPGQLVLQDLPGTVGKLDASKLAPIKAEAHDFFTPEPIKGARGYYLKMVLHDVSNCLFLLFPFLASLRGFKLRFGRTTRSPPNRPCLIVTHHGNTNLRVTVA